jgi:tetratricopeptide (TPR) repeat protein
MTLLNVHETFSQHNSVFSLVKKDERLADEYMRKKDYRNALELYKGKYNRRPDNHDIGLKIASCYYLLKEYQSAFAAYEQLAKSNVTFSRYDLLNYAEASASIQKITKAAELFRMLVNLFPNDTIVANKLWRISNIQYLYEDSVHYVVRPIDALNSPASDILVSASAEQLTFLSDRPEVKIIEKVDAAGVNLYNLYQARRTRDTTAAELKFSRPVVFSGTLNMRSQAGPTDFYDHENKVVYATTSARSGNNGKHTLQLQFAEKLNNTWQITAQFPYNSLQYSITDPSISDDGTILYFVSDMPGGKGGKDIYQSVKVNHEWTKPENVAILNSPFDDITPFNHSGKAIYFSSNGHPGLGGFDIFKTERRGNSWTEVTNVGYPINSYTDDFGFILDSLGTVGYFTSNRKNGGLDDDMYNVEIDIQTYPITITSLVRIKEHNWSDSSALVPFANAKFALIDNVRNSTIYETTTDALGAVSIAIPYFSKYKIKITGPENDEHIVSFDIPKNSKVDDNYEIVLVKDMYESPASQDSKNNER